jgi:hypothetical protein
MKAIQVWLPQLGGSIHRPRIARDAARTFQQWQDELVVWLLPEVSAPRRWQVARLGNLALPSETFERIDIVHVTEDGDIYAPTRPDLPLSIGGLLEGWLNNEKAGGCDYIYSPESIAVPTPEIEPSTGAIGTRVRTCAIGAGTYIPLDSIDADSRSVGLRWPPAGSPATVSPEAESGERLPSKRVESDLTTVVTEQGSKALHLLLRWPPLFTAMMPLLSGPDDLLAQAAMARLARLSRSDLQSALREARLGSHPYLSRGDTTVEHGWFRPTLKRKVVKHVLLKAEGRQLYVPSRERRMPDEKALKEALKRKDWQDWLSERVPIRRAWGAVGLFWTLLLDHLEAQRSIICCLSTLRADPD